MDILLVGGAVRDLLRGHPGADKDYLVLGAGEDELLARFPAAKPVGQGVRAYIVAGHEYSLPRGSGAGDELAEDLAGRDLTVNAMALAPSGRLYAHPLALADLRDRVLRAASPEALTADPLRVFRVARFAAQWPDFSLHPGLLEQMRAACAAGLTTGLAAERVGMELRKATAAPAPGRFLRVLAEADCLEPWLAELAQAAAIPAGPVPFHDSSVLEHIARVMDRLAGDPLAVWMALTHDLGKTVSDPKRWPAHHGHEHSGAELAVRLAERLRLPKRHQVAGRLAASLHMKAGRYPELRPGSVVDLLEELHARNLAREMFALVRADGGPADGKTDNDHWPRASRDLETILAVHLPEEKRNQGAASAETLRLLRCQALSEARRAEARERDGKPRSAC